MAGKKIKLEEKVIGEILVADTDSESGVEASDVEDCFEEEEEEKEEEEQHHQQQQASAEVESQAATSGRLPTWGYVNNSEHMANSYSMSQRTFKWTMKLFFHLLDLTVLNSWIL